MRCRKCNERMKTNVKEQQYECDCGYKIKWVSDERDNERKV